MAGTIMRIKYSVLAILIVALLPGNSWSAGNLSDIGRKITKKNADAIVTIQIVLEQSFSYGGQTQKQESKLNATGTVIDDSGMVVTSLSQIDPTAVMQELDSSDFKVDIKVTDALIRLEDGTEIQMDVVVKDRDLNLAFLRPKEPTAKKMTFINMINPPNPPALEKVLTMYRLGQVAGRSVASEFDDIIAVVTKPRKFYVISNSWAQGGPAFTNDGRAIGIIVRKTNIKGAQRASGSAESLTIIMPTETVMQAAAQAKIPRN